jgi:3-hydroxyisobutyrate dehydrogenase
MIRMQRVALLGLGVMGAGMAANWLAKGFQLSVFNRTAAKAEPLASKGASAAATPREAAADADFIFAMVADDAASRSVWLGPDGALAGAKRGAIAVESSTLTPDWARELAGHARARGLGFLDAPVGGSRDAAETGALRFFVGGDESTFEAARPALAAVGTVMDRLGPVGAGVSWKLINNHLIAAQTAALAEALDIAGKAGFEAERISALILAGAAASPIVKAKLPRMLQHDYDKTDFALYLMLKDARYATALAQSLGASADVIAAAAKAFARAEAKGLGAKDFAAVAG